MDPKSIKELQILDEVSKSEHVNQRYLSKKLGMATGLVNLYIKRLAKKGYIKIKGMNRRRLKYLITPQGISEKTRLTYEFALISYKYFKNTTDEIKSTLAQMVEAGCTDVVVYGTGELAEMSLLLIKEFDIRVIAVVDDHADTTKFLGCPVVPREVLGDLRFDRMIVAQIDGREEIQSLLEEAGIDDEKVCWILQASPNDNE